MNILDYMGEEYWTTDFSRLLDYSKLIKISIIIYIKSMKIFACIEPQQVV
jgi:hypothetical protein